MVVTPRSRGAAEAVRWFASGPFVFLTGCVVGATCVGAALGVVGALPGGRGVGLLCLVVVVLLWFNDKCGIVTLGAPSSCWQVPREWAWAGRLRYSLVFGLLLGLGVVTIVKSWAVYMVLAGAMAQGDMFAGTGVGAVFGFARAMPMLLVSLGFRRGASLSGGDAEVRKRLGRLAGPEWLLEAIEAGAVGVVGGATAWSLVG